MSFDLKLRQIRKEGWPGLNSKEDNGENQMGGCNTRLKALLIMSVFVQSCKNYGKSNINNKYMLVTNENLAKQSHIVGKYCLVLMLKTC